MRIIPFLISTVVEGIVYKQEIRFVHQHLLVEPPGAALRIFSANGSIDDVDHGIWIECFQLPEQLIGIGSQRIDHRGLEIARRHRMSVKNQVDGPVFGPLLFQFRFQSLQVIGLAVGFIFGMIPAGENQQQQNSEE